MKPLFHRPFKQSACLSLLALAVIPAIPGTADAAVTVLPGSSFTWDGVDGPLVPSGVVPSNLASAPEAAAFAIDVGHNPPHSIPNLNNGVYGNSDSWIGVGTRPIDVDGDGTTDVDTTFAGIDFAGTIPQNISSFAFGRSNLGDEFADRTAGTYQVQLTTASNPDASTLDTAWSTIGSIEISTSSFGDTYRHLYTLDSPMSATGIRILTPGTGTDIDEIEVFAIPEPSSVLLAAFGILSFAILRRRRRV